MKTVDMKKIMLVAMAMLSLLVHAQQATNHYHTALDNLDPLHQHVCGNDVEFEAMLLENPALRHQYEQEQQAAEIRYQQFLENEFDPNSRSTYIVPVVFHVVHEGGSENISDEQIYDALDQLNMDFDMTHPAVANTIPAFQGIVGNGDVEFRIATRDPNGNCHKGITRTYMSGGGAHDTGDNGDIRSAIQAEHGVWPQNSYMNVIIVKNINGSAAYTNKPGNWYNPYGMGGSIYTRHTYMGTIGTGSPSVAHTLAHEVGHWLNLSHCWGNNNSAGDAGSCGTDDNVTDTPNTIGWSGACILDGETCGSLDNVQNIMDYGSCRTMFTQGQCAKMQFALQPGEPAERYKLWQPGNLAATGVDGPGDVCEAIFSSNARVVCVGQSVDFEDESYHNVSSRNWTFNGGSPGTSTAANPTVQYNTPGVYTVSLTVSDGSNNATVNENNYIIVLDAQGTALPHHEGFEFVTSIPDNVDWMVDNPDGGEQWQLDQNVGAGGTNNSAVLKNFYAPESSIDDLMSGTIDLSTVDPSDQVIFSFEYAYKKKYSSNNETLKLFVSNDCGETWALRHLRTGDFLGANTTSAYYTPAASDWTYVEVTNINSPYFVSGFRYKFEFDSDQGNNIYIDNINLYPASMADLNEQTKESSLNVFPNPTSGLANIQFNAEKGVDYHITVLSTLGQQVDVIHNGQLSGGLNNFEYSTVELAKGMYIIKIESANNIQTVKLIKE
jgi:PKD repeat protein